VIRIEESCTNPQGRGLLGSVDARRPRHRLPSSATERLVALSRALPVALQQPYPVQHIFNIFKYHLETLIYLLLIRNVTLILSYTYSSLPTYITYNTTLINKYYCILIQYRISACLSRVVTATDQKKRIAPIPFFHGYRKRQLKD
jgi:hypothetical protein